MTDLRASAFLCWLLAVLGGVTFYCARVSSGEPGGVFSYATYARLSSAGLVLLCVAGASAVGLHVAEFFAAGRERRKRFSDALEGWPRDGGET